MTTQKLFKRRVRERMDKTGERYAAARRHVASARDHQAAAPTLDLSGALELASEEKVTEATGRGWEAWIGVLDDWGAPSRSHTDTARYLVDEQGVPSWYAQAITNGYERVRGLRVKHEQRDGFTVYASKTVAVPDEVLLEAFADDAIRGEWLTDGSMAVRSVRRPTVARFNWGDGTTRVMVTVEAKGDSKATASVVHERLPDAATAEVVKGQWRKRLVALKEFLEARRTD